MTQQPNLIFIMADQLRPDFLSCYGADFIETPNIDRLANEGVRFENAYSAHPICVPARASLLTGRDAIKNGVTDNGQWLRPDLAACGIQTWPELLSEAGYYTAAIGKMHFYPWDINHGFQYKVGAEDKRWIHVRDDYYHFLQAHGYRKLHGNEHEGYYENKGAIINRIPWEYSVDHFTGQQACHFIRQYGQESPIAMMISFPGPHCPYDPNPEFLEGIDPEALPPAIPAVPDDTPVLRQQNIHGNRQAWNGVDYTEFTEAHKQKIRLHYAALVKQIDLEVGDVLQALEETDQLDNSIIIFVSDHGDFLGDHDLIGKGSFYEASMHVPLIVRLPEATGGVVSNALVALGDVTATLLHFGGCHLPAYMDSKPLPDIGIPDTESRSEIIGMTSSGWMIYDGEWRLAKYSTGETCFFNIKADPTEQKNLLHDPQHQATLRALEARLSQAIMQSATASHEANRVYSTSAESLSGDPGFGKEGWQRAYPKPL